MFTAGQTLSDPLPESIWKDPALAAKYRRERTIGTGGMGVVVAARHIELDEPVAIKFLLPTAARSSTALARFRKEARAAAKIRNEHVVRISDVSSTSTGIPYIVMEYLDGRDLERILLEASEHRLPIQDAVDFILQAGEALAEAHRLGIVHRDLKPANLFCVDRFGAPLIKILDFGISKLALSDVEQTDQYEILGSPRYMSPEQIDSSSTVDQRSDIWSAGVVLYQTLTGQLPFPGDVVPDVWRQVRTHTPPPPSSLRPEITGALSAVVMRCLEKEPARRFANFEELAKALAPFAPRRSRTSLERIVSTPDVTLCELLSDTPHSVDPSLIEPGAPQESRLRRWRLAATAAVVLAIGTLAAVFAQLFVLKVVKHPTEDSRPVTKPSTDQTARSERDTVPHQATASSSMRESAPSGSPPPTTPNTSRLPPRYHRDSPKPPLPVPSASQQPSPETPECQEWPICAVPERKRDPGKTQSPQ